MFNTFIGLGFANVILESADMSSASSRAESSNSSAEPPFADDMRGFSTILRRLSRKKEFSDFSKIADKNRVLEGTLASKEAEIKALRSSKEAEIKALRSTKDTEIKALQSAKETEIEALQSANAKLELEKTALQLAKDALFDEFTKKYGEWSTGTNRQEGLEREVATLQLQLTQANQRAKDSEDALTNVQQQLDGCQGELIGFQNELLEVNETLQSETEKLKKKQLELDGTWARLEECESILEKEREELGLEDLNLDDL
jgi:chromosome segregation ATPase